MEIELSEGMSKFMKNANIKRSVIVMEIELGEEMSKFMKNDNNDDQLI